LRTSIIWYNYGVGGRVSRLSVRKAVLAAVFRESKDS